MDASRVSEPISQEQMENGPGVKPTGGRFPGQAVPRTLLAALPRERRSVLVHLWFLMAEHLLCASCLPGPWTRLDKGPWCLGA